jgi:hypothetical protein
VKKEVLQDKLFQLFELVQTGARVIQSGAEIVKSHDIRKQKVLRDDEKENALFHC